MMKRSFVAMLAVAVMLCCTACGSAVTTPGEDDELLEAYAQRNGYSLDLLMCSQLILVRADGSGAVVDCYERSSAGGYEACEGLSGMQAYISADGMTESKTDGDTRTLSGLHILGNAFGCEPDPGTQLEYTEVTEQSCWITDPDSPDYNTWAETGDEDIICERFSLEREKYAYAVTVEYNTDPVIRGKGTAFFLHCGSQPTDGGIAIGAENMKNIIKWLTPEGLACVLICKA